MPGVPSNKACERCKKRHLKCDESRPQCERCTNAGVECPGYVQTRKFIDQGASVRRRYAPYQEPRPASNKGRQNEAKEQLPEREQNAPKRPANQPQSRTELAKLPKSIRTQSGFHPENPGSNQDSPVAPLRVATAHHMTDQPGVEATSGLAASQSNSSISISQHSITPGSVVADAPRPASHLDFRPTQPSPPPRLSASRSPPQRSDKEEFQDIFSELMTGTEHEISFLVRHFSEVLAPWLDLSDTAKFFEAYVPIRAIDEPCLKYSIAALSAKHLGRMKGVKYSASSGMFTSPATTETYPNSLQVDWLLKAANYYYLAVSHMNSSISDAYATVPTSALLEFPIGIANRWLELHIKNISSAPRDIPTSDAFWRKTENLLATSVILTTYKLLDEPGESWQSYLAGAGPLFDRLVDLINNKSNTFGFSHGVTAVFWNLARQDYIASYFNRLPTHFGPENLKLWRAAGLPVDEQGNPSSPNEMTQTKVTCSREDLAANYLTWLLNKVSNFLAASKKSQLEHWTGQSSSASSSPTVSTPPSPRLQPTTSAWLKISFELQSWIERIPETFRPCLRLETPKNLSKSPGISPIPFPEIFYSLTSCASAMQQYHWGRLALSLNRPSDEVAGPSTAFDRLQGYRELTKEVDYRCREICGIALGRPQSGARIHMITLLFAVGQCVEKPEERQIIIDLLRGIEADLGWATTSQIQKLEKSWDDRT